MNGDLAWRAGYARNGFVLLPGAVEPDLERLRTAAKPILVMQAEGKLRDARRHQTILQPGVYHPAFLGMVNHPDLNACARALIGDDGYFFAELALLTGSATHDLCRWHRDFSDDDAELPDLLKTPQGVIQYNIALYDDPSLWVVPGSHSRTTTREERSWASRFDELGFFDDFGRAAAIAPDVLPGMPGARQVRLAPGDALLYNPILWHAAEYPAGALRATFHGTWKHPGFVDRFKALRWGFDHNPWLLEPAYLGELGPFVSRQLPVLQSFMRRYARECLP